MFTKLAQKISLLLVAISLVACSSQKEELTEKMDTVKKESLEAAENLKNEAENLKNTVETKVDQVNTAVDSVNQAVDSVNTAVENVKKVSE